MRPSAQSIIQLAFGRRAQLTGRFSSPWIAVGLLLLWWLAPAVNGAAPTFENRTPVGFSTQDSTTQENFVLGNQVTVRVDLNQATTPTHPVYGHFHNLERSKQVESTDVDGLHTDLAIDSDGVLHMAWISQETGTTVTSPVYYVRYARSEDQGQTFSTPVSVSGTLRYDLLTLNVANTGNAFSTVDIEVDSRGNPRVVYAFNHSPDGHTAKFVDTSGDADNVYLNYSENGGASWLPGDKSIVVNDSTTVGSSAQSRTTGFPRMVVDQRDNIFITYVRGSSTGSGKDDIMLTKVDRETTPFTLVEVGSTANGGSKGGVRISPDGDRQTGPDISIGTGDVLHVAYFNDANDDIEHKTLLADSWQSVTTAGWNQDVDGADIDDFIDEAIPAAIETDVQFYFPTVVVDQQSSPDKIYAVYKFGDDNFETVFFNSYTYDNAVGASAGWTTASAAAVWSTATSPIFADGATNYNIEVEWTVTERVAALVDDRLPDKGELHIAFSAGYSTATALAIPSTRAEHDIYYGFYNGTSWILPEKVADDDSDSATEDGIAVTDVFLGSPVLAKATSDTSLFLAFAAGTAEGLGVRGVADVNHHAYLKVLGRAVTSEDQSVPVGAFQYDLSYTPINPQNLSAEITNNAVYVHAADNADGSGLGATGKRTSDGFLAGDWESIGTSLRDTDKFFEGKFNEDTSTTNEWGDDDDKKGLLVKLNVLGSDSSTNIQAVTTSSATNTVATPSLGGTVTVGSDPTGAFVVVGDFFLLGADIDIVTSNTSPSVSISQPDGVGDEASTSFPIVYNLSDIDDDLASTGLLASIYFSSDSSLVSVQDIRIFGTLIADENDVSSIFTSGTDDLAEGQSESYTWDEPSAALKAKLFASITQVISGTYYIYLIADDQKNPPVFARSPGAVTIKHRPIIVHVDPASADTVDTGVRSGEKSNPYDLDFTVRDFDLQGTAEIQLFYSSVSGLNSVSTIGTFPSQRFTLGKSVAGVRAIPITGTDTLTSIASEVSWDITDSVAVRVGASVDSQIVAENAYFIYLVASDSMNVAVGQSIAALTVKHSPAFTFYEPPKDTHRKISTGRRPIFSIQWQKGRGDQDFDNNATIDFYFTTDNPATINYEDFPDSLLKDADTQIVVKGLTEDAGGKSDIYAWDLTNPPNDVPRNNRKVWLYAIISDSNGNSNVALGGALTMTHDPRITLLSSKLNDYSSFQKNDVLRITWDDYMVDDGSGTDDAYIRLYASTTSNFTTTQQLESDIGSTGFLINSSNGLTTGTLSSIREDSLDFFDWNTKLFGSAGSSYYIYAAINPDLTFGNSTNSISRSSAPLALSGTGSTPNISLSPTDQVVAVGDTVTMDVMVQHTSPITLVQVVLKLNSSTSFSIVDQSTAPGPQPFIDLDEVFAGTSPIENTFDPGTNKLRFSKSSFLGQLVGSPTAPASLARFQLVPTGNLVASPSLTFSTGEKGSVLGVVGKTDPFDSGEGLTLLDPQFTRVIRGTITATVELEGRTLGDNNFQTFLDVHLRQPGSAIDITDPIFISVNDGNTATSDTVEVQSALTTGALSLSSVPPGRYELTVKDTSHISGRTDIFTVTNGQSVAVTLFGSDLRGDPTSALANSGRRLIAGDTSEDNEINEDDVNIIIAAWGSTTTAPSFQQADLNNDNQVGASDLTATTSNFGNSQGFGAPPVYKRAGIETNDRAAVEILPLFDVRQPLWPGREIEIAVQARDLDDLAGYEFDLHFDPQALRLVADGTREGDIFAANPRGAVFEARTDAEGKIEVIGARYGKEWAAAGDGALARLRFEIL
ncbi:MAG: hypothetical protein VX293_04700, partial [Candidatus Latescibacterota bacterium]|nr:hypothetical protein [Candidatus Latescibacterota bacterium]